MKTTLSILAALLLVPLFVFGDSPVLRNDLTTNSTPIAAATVRGAINGTTGTGNAVFADRASMTDLMLTVLSNATAKITSLFSGSQFNTNTITSGEVDSPIVKAAALSATNTAALTAVTSGSQVNTNTITTGELDSPTVKSGSQLNTNTITTSEIDATTAKFNTALVTNTVTANTLNGANANLGPTVFTNTPTLPAQVSNSIWAGPVSGANAVPTFRAMVNADLPSNITPGGQFSVTSSSPTNGSIAVSTNASGVLGWTSNSGATPNYWWLRNMVWKEWGYSTGASSSAGWGAQSWTLSAGTTTISPPSASFTMAAIDLITANSSNSTSGVYMDPNTLGIAANLQCGWLIMPTNVSNIRFFCGFTRAGNQTTMVQSDVPGIDAVGFHYVNDAAVANVNYNLMSCDNSTTSTNNTGFAAAASPTMFWVIGNDAGTSFDMWINGSFIGTMASNSPRNSQSYAPMACLSTVVASVKSLRVYFIRGRSRISL